MAIRVDIESYKQASVLLDGTLSNLNSISNEVGNVLKKLDYRIKSNVDISLNNIINDLNDVYQNVTDIVSSLDKSIDTINNIETKVVKEVDNQEVSNTELSGEASVVIEALNGAQTTGNSSSDVDLEQKTKVVKKTAKQIKKLKEEMENNPDLAMENQAKIAELIESIFTLGLTQQQIKDILPTNYQKSLGFIVLDDYEIAALQRMNYEGFSATEYKGYLTVAEYEQFARKNKNFSDTYDFLNGLNLDEEYKRGLVGLLFNQVTIVDGEHVEFGLNNNLDATKIKLYTDLVNNFMIDRFPPEQIKSVVSKMLQGRLSQKDEKMLLTGYINDVLNKDGLDSIFELGLSNDKLRELISLEQQKYLGIVILSEEELATWDLEKYSDQKDNLHYLTTDEYERIYNINHPVIYEQNEIAPTNALASDMDVSNNVLVHSAPSGYDYKENPDMGFVVTTGNLTYSYTEDELRKFYAVVYGEAAANQDDALAVASVILNRMDEKAWGGQTLNGVLVPGQFSAMKGSRYSDVYYGYIEVPDYVKKACDDALNGIRNNNYDSFRSKDSTSYSSIQITSDGNRYKNEYTP